MTHALVTNDDGTDSAGLLALAQAAVAAGLDVTIAAPSWDSSGASCALTGVQQDGRLAVNRREPVLGDVPVFAVDGAPSMIIIAGLRGGFGPVPDLVLSGVNRGRNTGRAVIHSGTVGAAMTAINHGFPGVAVSLDADLPTEWATAATVAVPLIRWVVATRPEAVININVPDLPLPALRGVRQAPLAAIGAIQTNVSDADAGYLQMTYEAVVEEPAPGTDAQLLAEGWVTVSAISPLAPASIDLPAFELQHER